MKLSIVKNASHLLEVTSPDGEVFNVATHDLIAAIAATVGHEVWIDSLIQAHMLLASRLSGQNFGDVGTDSYGDFDSGVKMELLCGAIANQLMDLRDADNTP